MWKGSRKLKRWDEICIVDQNMLGTNMKKYKRLFLLNNSTPKIKHETLFNNYEAGGLKNVDIPNKIIALQYSWIRRLYDDSFHE